jgi:hypothetical protein
MVSSLNFLVNAILICYCYSQILELGLTFKGFIRQLEVMILSCSLVMRHEDVGSVCVYFLINFLTHI